jgi:hypothetical protein
MSRKVVIGIIVGCGALCAIAAVLALVAGGAFYRWVVQEPENVKMGVEAPVSVVRGEPFIIEVRVENLAAEPQILDSIDIAEGYLSGIAIRSSDPPFTESYSLPVVDFRSYTLGQSIAAGETLVVRFDAVGLQAGDYAGEIDVCVGSGSVCTTFLTRTLVED